MYVISIKRTKDPCTDSDMSEWEYFQYDCSSRYPFFGSTLSYARKYITVEEAEKAFRENKGNMLGFNAKEYDMSTLGIREVKYVFKTEKLLEV